MNGPQPGAPRRRRRPQRRAPHRRTPGGRTPPGFTLIEVLVAVTLLAVGLLALAGLAANSLRVVRSGAALTTATALAQSRFDSLASVPCAQIQATAGTGTWSRTDTTRRITEKWSVRMMAEFSNNMVQVTDTMRVPGRTRVYAFVSERSCR